MEKQAEPRVLERKPPPLCSCGKEVGGCGKLQIVQADGKRWADLKCAECEYPEPYVTRSILVEDLSGPYIAGFLDALKINHREDRSLVVGLERLIEGDTI